METQPTPLTDELFAQRINEMIGYVENGTSEVLTIFQDDATMTYWVKIGRRSYHHRSLLCALQQALVTVQGSQTENRSHD